MVWNLFAVSLVILIDSVLYFIIILKNQGHILLNSVHKNNVLIISSSENVAQCILSASPPLNYIIIAVLNHVNLWSIKMLFYEFLKQLTFTADITLFIVSRSY